MLDYVALGVIFFLLVLVTVAIVALGSIPGKIARKRGHPWPDAVNAASWIGLATGVFWPVAFIWAFLPIPQRLKEGSADATADTSAAKAELDTALSIAKSEAAAIAKLKVEEAQQAYRAAMADDKVKEGSLKQAQFSLAATKPWNTPVRANALRTRYFRQRQLSDHKGSSL